MSRRLLVGVIVLFGSLVWSQTESHSQQRPPKPPVEVVPTWTVQVIGAGGRVDEVVGTYYSNDAAQEAEQRWYKQHPDSLKLTKIVEGYGPKPERGFGGRKTNTPEATGTGPKGRTIVKPDLPWVDPGSFSNKGEKATSIAGKKGKGQIEGLSTYDVTIAFDGDENKGDVTITGDTNANGKWIQLGPYVRFETEKSKFEGKLVGTKLSGIRTRKDDSNSKANWSIDFEEKPSLPANPNVRYSIEVRVNDVWGSGIDGKKGWRQWMPLTNLGSARDIKDAYDTKQEAQNAADKYNQQWQKDAKEGLRKREINHHLPFELRIQDSDGNNAK